jgi:glycosyltransferase involved in cell wall biosynthesis
MADKVVNRTNVAVIIPAYNEEARIERVIQAAVAAQLVDRVIVVSDGSVDRTADVAASYCVDIVNLPKNIGKGGAMLHGAKCADGAELLIFLDADLVGLLPEHIDSLARPVLSGESSMAIGQFVDGRGLTDLAQLLVKSISGQRAIPRDLFLSIPSVDAVGYGVEMLITLHVSAQKLITKVVPLRGVTHPMKEEKLGLLRGLVARASMYIQMGQFWASYHFRGKPPTLTSAVLTEVRDESHIVVSNGSGQDKAVDSVQNAPVAR